MRIHFMSFLQKGKLRGMHTVPFRAMIGNYLIDVEQFYPVQLKGPLLYTLFGIKMPKVCRMGGAVSTLQVANQTIGGSVLKCIITQRRENKHFKLLKDFCEALGYWKIFSAYCVKQSSIS